MNDYYIKEAIDTILKSRRLLSDHLQIVEQCGSDIKEDKVNKTYLKYGIINSSLVLGVSTIAGTKLLSLRSSIIAVSGLFATTSITYYVWNMIKGIKLNRQWKQIDQLLANISLFDVCIRKNISFFKETQQFKISLDDKSNRNKNSLVQSVLYSNLAVTQALYEATTYFEYYPLPLEYADLYQNVENLQDCELFQKPTSDFDESHIKDLYNIFLYIQSQFLTRFALAIVYNTPEVSVYLKTGIQHLNKFIADDLRNDQQRLLSTTKAIQRNNEQLHRNNIRDHVSSEPIRQLKENSLELSSKILSLATHCSNFDGLIQTIDSNDSNHYKTVPNDMKILRKSLEEIESTILLCKEDAKHLALVFEKFLASRYSVVMTKQTSIEQPPDNQSQSIELCKKVDEQTPEENQDYFASIDLAKVYADNEQELKVSVTTYSLDDELNQMNSKLVRRQFKPVLKQLKNKISPIGAVMHKREIEYLQAKGLPTTDVSNDNKLLMETNESDSNESDDEQIKSDRHQMKKDTYSDRREFLQSKAQSFVLPPPLNLMKKIETFGSDEEILE